MAKTSYAIALGSNKRGRYGSPAATLRAAAETLAVERLSSIRFTPALGPAGRSFANAAALISSELTPSDLLAELKAIERTFGRRGGRRWGPRVLDLDIILWSGGAYADPVLILPHPLFRERLFVLEPLAEIAPHMRDPISGRTVRQLLSFSRRPRPVDRGPSRP